MGGGLGCLVPNEIRVNKILALPPGCYMPMVQRGVVACLPPDANADESDNESEQHEDIPPIFRDMHTLYLLRKRLPYTEIVWNPEMEPRTDSYCRMPTKRTLVGTYTYTMVCILCLVLDI